MAHLRKNGYHASIVEKWNQFARIRQDFGGFADILAYKPQEAGVLAIQATSDEKGGNVSARVKKLTAPEPDDKHGPSRIENIKAWLGAGNRLEVWGFGKRGERGARKLWTLRVIPITLDHFQSPQLNGVSTQTVPA